MPDMIGERSYDMQKIFAAPVSLLLHLLAHTKEPEKTAIAS